METVKMSLQTKNPAKTKAKAERNRSERLQRWVDKRLPLFSMMRETLFDYPMPKRQTYWWNFGSLIGLMLFVMIATGLFLAVHYTPDANAAFDSVEHIMRDVNNGWLIRNAHKNGASILFILLYLHLFQTLYRCTYKSPREILWWLGVIALILLMATAFTGYVLPWGQMSLWAATVVTNIFTAIPFIGDGLVEILLGGFSADTPTLKRFFILHFLLPFIVFGVSIAHVWALRVIKRDKPAMGRYLILHFLFPFTIIVMGCRAVLNLLSFKSIGTRESEKNDTGPIVPFDPYFTVKGIACILTTLLALCILVFWYPDMLGHSTNYVQANHMLTPPQIMPEWYLMPLFAILRAAPDKVLGAIVIFGSVFILFALPWLDRSKNNAKRERPYYNLLFWIFVADCIFLGYLGSRPYDGIWVPLTEIATIYYFAHFLVLLPLVTHFETRLAQPREIISWVRRSRKRAKAARRRAKTKYKNKLSIIALISVVCSSSVALTDPGHAASSNDQTRAWSWQGILGTYDKAQLRRGYQIYNQTCSACHSMRLLSFRHLSGAGFDEAQIKTIASEFSYLAGPNEKAEMYYRPGLPQDSFPDPFTNDIEATLSNGGALPLDLSVFMKAHENGADYVYTLLLGYETRPDNILLPVGRYYNPVFDGGVIAMPPPLFPGLILHADGTPASPEQMAQDITAFLQWSADPHMEDRKAMGLKVIPVLCVLILLFIILKHRLWSKLT